MKRTREDANDEVFFVVSNGTDHASKKQRLQEPLHTCDLWRKIFVYCEPIMLAHVLFYVSKKWQIHFFTNEAFWQQYCRAVFQIPETIQINNWRACAMERIRLLLRFCPKPILCQVYMEQYQCVHFNKAAKTASLIKLIARYLKYQANLRTRLQNFADEDAKQQHVAYLNNLYTVFVDFVDRHTEHSSNVEHVQIRVFWFSHKCIRHTVEYKHQFAADNTLQQWSMTFDKKLIVDTGTILPAMREAQEQLLGAPSLKDITEHEFFLFLYFSIRLKENLADARPEFEPLFLE